VGRYVPAVVNSGPNSNQQRGSQLADVAVSSYAKEALAKKQAQEERERLKNTPQFPRNYEILSQANYAGIVKKIKEFNAALAADQATQAAALDANLVNSLDSLVKIIQESATGSAELQLAHFSALDKMLAWPQKNLFPVLDLLRCVILLNSAGKFYGEQQISILDRIMQIAFTSNDNVLLAMGLRFIANMFHHPLLRVVVVKYAQNIINSTKGLESNPDVKVKTAYASVLHK